ncbi:hypothetical protein KAR91_05110 [Candidatus Pacearchaeota archaeon]|nr:hypothetical protein [Candidatus Pacearchaeota archaeon]
MIKQAFFLTTWDEEMIEEVLERFPKLGERVRDPQVIGTVGEQIIVHIITQNLPKYSRLAQRVEYLGCDYREVAQKAKAGNTTCRKVLGQIIFTNWEIDNPTFPEEGPPRINHKGNLKEWILAGRPTRSSWAITHVWFGNDLEIPSESEIED